MLAFPYFDIRREGMQAAAYQRLKTSQANV